MHDVIHCYLRGGTGKLKSFHWMFFGTRGLRRWKGYETFGKDFVVSESGGGFLGS